MEHPHTPQHDEWGNAYSCSPCAPSTRPHELHLPPALIMYKLNHCPARAWGAWLYADRKEKQTKAASALAPGSQRPTPGVVERKAREHTQSTRAHGNSPLPHYTPPRG